MTTNEKVARRKLSLLELAKELNNVSKACKLIGYSRQQFYEIRRNYQTYGAEGLLDKLPGCKGAHPVIPPFLGAFKSRGHAAFARCCFGV